MPPDIPVPSDTDPGLKTAQGPAQGTGLGIVDGSRPEPWTSAQLRLAAVLGVSQCPNCGLTSELHKDGVCPGQPRPAVDLGWLARPCEVCGETVQVTDLDHWHGPFEMLWRSLSRRRRRG